MSQCSKIRIAFIVSLVFVSAAAHANAGASSEKDHRGLFELWARISAPYRGPAAAIGNYSAGCLRGAEKLPLDGPGFQVMRPSRKRYFGHPSLVRYIKSLGERLQSVSSTKMPLMLVGDLGRPRGGPMISGHASHQSGLDVDIWYLMKPKRLARKERESLSAVSMVSGGKLRGWTERETKLVAAAASFDEVERIFVDAAIKKHFCENSPEAPWLYKLRPWWNHADHLHVRLRCPAGDASCQAQEPLDPANPGCGTELAWWFTPEAEEEWKKKIAVRAAREFPNLPKECETLVM